MREEEGRDAHAAYGVPTKSTLSLRAKLFPFYHKWITGAFPTRDFRSLVTKCTTFSTMLISSKYVSDEHPFGLGALGARIPNYVDGDRKGDDKDKVDKKEKKEKKDKGKDKEKDKKGKKEKGKKDKGKKDKGKKDKDKKEKKDKSDKQDKGKKDKKGEKDKDKEDKKDKVKKISKGNKEGEKENDAENKLHSIRDILLRRESESLSVFAPCMTFVKCPYGPEGEECTALKKAALSALSADRCWFRYMEELSQCKAEKGNKDCVKRLSAQEQACNNHTYISTTNAKAVLGE